MAGNLKPAPLDLTPAVTAKLIGDWPAYGRGIARIPVLDTKLVDQVPSGEKGGSERG